MTTLAQPHSSADPRGVGHPPEGLFAVLRRCANSWNAYRAAASERRACAAADEKFWQAALADPRIMAEIERARSS